MQPYQTASEEIKRQGNAPINTAKNIASVVGTGAGLVSGAGIVGAGLKKVLPFLNKYIPHDIMVKGLSKVDPRYGKFIKRVIEDGGTDDEIKDFIKEKLQGNEESQLEPAKKNGNIIEQYSPELFQFINEQIKNGRKPIEAGAIAQNDKRFKDVIGKISKDHKTPWSNILESVFGGTGMAQSQQQEAPQGQSPQQGGGQGQQKLMAMLQQINQRFGQ